MPARADLDPLEMKTWLDGILLLDVHYNPLTLVYRLVGARSSSTRGKTVQEGYHGPALEEVLEDYRLVVEERTPVYDWSGTPSQSGVMLHAEALLLPLADDGETVNMVIVYIDTDRSPAADRRRTAY